MNMHLLLILMMLMPFHGLSHLTQIPVSGGGPLRALSQNARQAPKGRARGGKTATPKETAERGSIKAQAAEVLKDVIERSDSIAELDGRALVVSSASELLWQYDKEYAQTSISKLIDELTDQFKKKDQTSEHAAADKQKITTSINLLLKAMARKDPDLAEQMLQRFQNVREELVKDGPSNRALSEKFELAKESADINIRQSVALAAQVIEVRVPTTFPQYLYDLSRRDGPTADALYRKALTTLSSGRVYNVSEATLLSAYAFRERMLLMPVSAPRDSQAKSLEFGVFTLPLASPKQGTDSALANEYLGAAYSFVASQLTPGSSRAVDPAFLGQCFFLVRKLRLHAVNLGSDKQNRWQQLEFNVGSLARNVGLDQSTLDYLGGFAQRLVLDSNVFQFDGGAAAFERANKTDDKEQRTRLVVAGIWSLIQEQKFVEAENRIKVIDVSALRDQLNDLLNYSAGMAVIEKREWGETALSAAKIKDAEIRLLLLLEGARAVTSGRGSDQTFALQYLNEALNIIPKLESGEHRAKGLVVIASMLSSIDRQWGNEVLLKAVNEINKTESYDRGNFELELSLPGMTVPILLADSTLESCFKRLAKADWDSVQDTVKGLNSEVVRSVAQIAACRAVL